MHIDVCRVSAEKYAYEKAKIATFKSYELVPEASRKNSVITRKNNHSWVDFQKIKERLLEK